MKSVIAISEWHEKEADRGKYKGSKSRVRDVIAVDNWNWVIGEDNTKTITGDTYYGNVKSLFSILFRKMENPEQFKILATNFIKQVSLLLNKPLMDISAIALSTEKQAESLGLALDNFYNLSYLREHPPTVTQRLFGDIGDD
jgi:hypothetical protein